MNPVSTRRRQAGTMTIELLVAAAMVLAVFMPLGLGIVHQHRLARDLHLRAVIAERLDGELEVLAAGGWRQLPAGGRKWGFDTGSGTLPPRGHFAAWVTNGVVRVSWHPGPGPRSRPFHREARLPADTPAAR